MNNPYYTKVLQKALPLLQQLLPGANFGQAQMVPVSGANFDQAQYQPPFGQPKVPASDAYGQSQAQPGAPGKIQGWQAGQPQQYYGPPGQSPGALGKPDPGQGQISLSKDAEGKLKYEPISSSKEVSKLFLSCHGALGICVYLHNQTSILGTYQGLIWQEKHQ